MKENNKKSKNKLDSNSRSSSASSKSKKKFLNEINGKDSWFRWREAGRFNWKKESSKRRNPNANLDLNMKLK